MPNAASHEIGSMKYGPPHQYKQMFPGSPAGYGTYANQNGYPVSNGIISNTGSVEDVSMSKYKDNNIYGTNQQVAIIRLSCWLCFLVIILVPFVL